MTQKSVNLKKNLLIIIKLHYYSNALDADVFNARSAQANLMTKTDFDARLSNLNDKITRINKNIYLMKMGSKS